jgi:hypothetical protein
MRRSSVALLFGVLLSTGGAGFAQNETTDSSKIRLEFLGKDPASDWAKAVSALVDSKLVPMKTLTLQKGQSPCGAILEQLKFRDVGLTCSDEMQALIKKLNPGLPSPLPIGQVINYPDLPVAQMTWGVGFDSAVPDERNRFDKVKSIWKQFQVNESVSGKFLQLEFKGISTEFDVPTTPDTTFAEVKKSIDSSVDHFNPDLNRYDTRAVALQPSPPSKVRFAATPVEWGKNCSEPGNDAPPQPPGPPYISLINGADGPSCATNCKLPGSPGCPQIVLIDEKVAIHPDLAQALGEPQPANANVKWCPLAPFDESKQHGTHMAGIMVSSGATSAFQGIAPQASLVSRQVPDPAIGSVLDENRTRPGMTIYVYASKFDNTPEIFDSNERLHKPSEVENLLNAGGLWVVAAGQPPDAPHGNGREISGTSALSPMNLGDQKNVLVVTNCEHCYDDQARISSWANYSLGGLVNVAAPGGTEEEKIPSTVTDSQDGRTYGTSQATALVGGLAAEMASCYPQRYIDPSLLKIRLLTTSRALSSPEMASKISAGVVDAKMALLDPALHWVTLIGDTQRSARDLFFCTVSQFLNLRDVETGQRQFGIPVKNIRRIVQQQSPSGATGSVVYYESTEPVYYQGIVRQQRVIKVTPLARLADDAPSSADNPGAANAKPSKPWPLLYFRRGDEHLPQDAVPLESIQDLLVGFDNIAVPPNLKGCF